MKAADAAALTYLLTYLLSKFSKNSDPEYIAGVYKSCTQCST